jgi:hypothetical protein
VLQRKPAAKAFGHAQDVISNFVPAEAFLKASVAMSKPMGLANTSDHLDLL